MKNRIYLLLIITSLSLANGCYYDVNEDLYPSNGGLIQCDTLNITYNNRVLAIIQNNCYSCHTGATPLANINLQGYANLKLYADNGKLEGVINHASGYAPMPKGGNKLSNCDINAIHSWINKGALNN